jgi:CHAT domain-containing protein/tetratricopeptide (TPR) repeat protein/Tol biopolymer transport system component
MRGYEKRILFPMVLFLSFALDSPLWAEKTGPLPLPVNSPIQVTAEAASILYADVSRDGKELVYTTGRAEFTDLYLRSADPSVVILPVRLTADPASESDPAFSPDGNLIAFVGSDYDAKGDIYLMDLRSKEKPPKRLTGRETEEGAPAFSSDGKRIYFHQSRPGDEGRRIVTLDLSSTEKAPEVIDTLGDASFPAVSPDGTRIAFVSHRNDLNGDIFYLDTSSGKVVQLTKGSEIDLHPAWASDGRHVYFTRFGLDTDRDGKVTYKDNASIYRVAVDDNNPTAYPLTSAAYSCFQPKVAAAGRLFFLSTRGGVSNVWVLPAEGEIPTRISASEQMDLADRIAKKVPPDPYLSLLAHYRVLEAFSSEEPFAGRASYETGRLYLKVDMPDAAEVAFRISSTVHGRTVPEAALSGIETVVIETKGRTISAEASSLKEEVLNKGLSDIDGVASRHQRLPKVQARAGVEKAKLLLILSQNPPSILKAISFLDRVIAEYKNERIEAAEALVLRADAYAQVGMSEQVYPEYLKVIDDYPDIEEWADRAVERILEKTLKAFEKSSLESRTELLRGIAEKNRASHPRVAMGALNRLGDLFYRGNEWERAKAAFRQVLAQYPIATTQTASARLALAEILYREERFREAIDLYEKELGLRSYQDHIYLLARAGYIRKSVDSGEFLYRIGEVASARKIFKELIDYDSSIIEAYRGYIKCAAAQKEVLPLLASYREWLKQRPDDPIANYTLGLTLTYLEERPPLREAKSLILRAIGIYGQSEYFHQTLGYIFEVLETVHVEKGSLEYAIESYQKALFLNDQRNNPTNHANLLLNLGNAYHLIGQHQRAYDFYRRRLESSIPFDNEETEILFYRRFGASAFQMRKPGQTIEAYKKALSIAENRMRPKQASDVFGTLTKYIKDNFIMAGSKVDALKKKADEVGEKQASINRRLFKLSQADLASIRDPGWEEYQRGMEVLLSEQKTIFPAIASLGEATVMQASEREKAVQNLSFMALKVSDALRSPVRFAELQAEMLDRLGLAYQEAGEWKSAIETFGKVYGLNQALGLTANLARNRRSAAYNRYLLAGQLTGLERVASLRKASEEFQEVLSLVQKYGVAKKGAERDKALISVALQVSLDTAAATQAAYGFSKEQEERLAEAFITRILTELGELDPAAQTIKKQLERYPQDKSIAEKDVYGVSLLYHRAGHLFAAEGRQADAFDAFGRSAELAHRLGNPVSASINAMNMAHVLAAMPGADPAVDILRQRLYTVDEKTTGLVSADKAIEGLSIVPHYHNVIGVYLVATAPAPGKAGLISASIRMDAYRRALSHFDRGLRFFKEARYDRKMLSLKAALHLNMAAVASMAADRAGAAACFEKALKTAKEAILPEIEWRALAGLGRTGEALDTLSAVPLIRAGAGPDEIPLAFSGLVQAKISTGKIEEAFNLAERLSELERVQRLSPLVLGEIPERERALYRESYPRIIRIRQLKEDLAAAKGEERAYLKRRLDQEADLLSEKLGKQRERIQRLKDWVKGDGLQEDVMILIGLATHAEEAADAMVTTNDEERKNAFRREYADLRDHYGKTLRRIMSKTDEEEAPDLSALFGPKPVEAIDIMETLSDDETLFRPFRMRGDQSRFLVFRVTKDDLEAKNVSSLDQIRLPGKGKAVIAYEEITALPGWLKPLARALSATHLVRSAANRKPFKRTLLAVSYDDPIPSAYAVKALSFSAVEKDITDAMTGSHLLLFGGPIAPAQTVPTRTAEVPTYFIGMEFDRGRRLSLRVFVAGLRDVSLALLPGLTRDGVYAAGHLLSIFGCPTVILPERTPKDSNFIKGFMEAYETKAADEALQSALAHTSDPWVFLGYRGMGPAEAHRFAEGNFVKYVRKGQAAFFTSDPTRALAYFENALTVAKETDSLRMHLPNLYRFSRECAYRAGDMRKAADYASALVDWIEEKEPDSRDHAEALLNHGLVLSRLERYEVAAPRLEKSLEIMANLELEGEQVGALASTGLVFENATEYDRALVHFRSALDLSLKLDKKELVARQHMNIGRLYDLRLSRYAAARQHYEKALGLYVDLQDAAGIAQAHLDIGRCYRLMGNFPDAELHYREALKLTKAASSGERLRAKIVIEQANNAWFQARYQEAFDLRREVYQAAVTGHWPLEQVISLNTSGLIWWTLNENDRALRELREALSLARKLEVRSDEIATTLNNIGIVYREMGRYDEALKTFDEALAIDQKLKSRWAIAYDLRNTALTYLRMTRADKALPLLEEAAAESHDIGDRVNEAKSLLGLGDAHSMAGNAPKARESFERALTLSRSMAIRETEWRALYGIGRLALQEGRREEAKEHLLRSIDVIEGMRADIKIEQLKDGFVTNKIDVYETLVRLQSDLGETEAAFETAERSRARNFIDLLGNQRLSLQNAVDQELYERQLKLRARIGEHEALAAQAEDQKTGDVYKTSLARLNDELRDLMLEIQAKNPQLTSMVSVAPLKMKEIQNLLEPGVVLLAYYVVPDQLLCWVVKRDKVKLIRAPVNRGTLGESILEFRQTIQNLEPTEKLSKELFSKLMSAVVPEIEGAEYLGIIPHGVLHYLSFATLYDGAQYTVDRFPLFSLPSASVLKYTLNRRKDGKNLRVLAIGNPDLDDPALNLPFAEQEVETIKWNFDSVTLLTKEKATESWVARNIGQFGIIHIASHGTFDPVNPLFSAVKLVRDDKADGNMEAGEVFGLEINADLVLLSACQTGLGRITQGDDVIGLNRAFFYAGTHSILSSLWRVSDISTAVLVKQFYRLYSTDNKAESLRRAMLHVKNRYPHPGYWGAFILSGDYY